MPDMLTAPASRYDSAEAQTKGRRQPVATAVDILTEQFTESSTKILKVLNTIEDAEFFWEPCADCWTVHRRSEPQAASADGSGEWVIDYEIPQPDPAPVTTIAWRT